MKVTRRVDEIGGVDRFEVVVKKRAKRGRTRCLSKALDDEGHFW